MSLVGCYVAHNAAAEIGASILSVKAYVDRFVVVDCAFASNPAAIVSTDDQRWVVEHAAQGVPLTYLEPGLRLEEHEARNLYLEQLELGDWALLIDADERLYGDHAALEVLAEQLSAGRNFHTAMQLRVYTTAVLAPLDAPDIDPELYSHSPRISTWGWMPKLVKRTALLRHRRIEVEPGIWTHHGIFDGDEPLHEAVRLDQEHDPIVVNDHAGQPYAGYQHDFRWEQAQRTGVRA